ncbi:MAG: hypothetical protein M4579_000688 [Chaenotheca gracillima]|nr:MAG: hypothetical protein M4579_000688 [Chaenotheca gracillima]
MRKKIHGLKRIGLSLIIAQTQKIRPTWNKYNLYNISRAKPLHTSMLTFFQQKWKAKSATRAYHGEQIREKQWTRMFRPRMASVMPMDHNYLAKHDGSDQSAGRGSGLETARPEKSVARTPYMNMVYAPIERRLDQAIFRALFASSARQARQFVVHGFVKVNGKKMRYPGYLLNPGDMFQVDPERVLWATGAPKDPSSSGLADSEGEAAEDIDADVEESTEYPEAEDGALEVDDQAKNPTSSPKQKLSELLARAKSILSNPSDDISGKRKQDLRSFQRSVRSALSKASSPQKAEGADVSSLDTKLSQLLSSLHIDSDTTSSSDASASKATSEVSDEDSTALRRALVAAAENPVDEHKPYATPWRPRDYMSPFAFIPRFLEVNQNICSAVYLRHPVARPGLAEVPSPFNTDMQGLAFTWYLRRR